jgi:hypothetical protein
MLRLLLGEEMRNPRFTVLLVGAACIEPRRALTNQYRPYQKIEGWELQLQFAKHLCT